MTFCSYITHRMKLIKPLFESFLTNWKLIKNSAYIVNTARLFLDIVHEAKSYRKLERLNKNRVVTRSGEDKTELYSIDITIYT